MLYMDFQYYLIYSFILFLSSQTEMHPITFVLTISHVIGITRLPQRTPYLKSCINKYSILLSYQLEQNGALINNSTTLQSQLYWQLNTNMRASKLDGIKIKHLTSNVSIQVNYQVSIKNKKEIKK